MKDEKCPYCKHSLDWSKNIAEQRVMEFIRPAFSPLIEMAIGVEQSVSILILFKGLVQYVKANRGHLSPEEQKEIIKLLNY